MSETTEGTSPVRTYWPSDYARLAHVIREARKDEPLTADVLASVTSSALAADSAEFDADTWLATTFARPAYVASMARTLRQARHVRCQPGTPKPGAEKVDTLAHAVDTVLAAAGIGGYSSEKFLEGTQLPDSGGHHLLGVVAGYDQDDDQDDDDQE